VIGSGGGLAGRPVTMPTTLVQKPVDDTFCPDDLKIRQAFINHGVCRKVERKVKINPGMI
jgi:hypothetical protein